MKSRSFYITIFSLALIGGCSTYNNAKQIEQPPQKLSQQPAINLPQINQTSISESQALRKNESQPQTKFKTITEDRGPGGVVNRVNVDNPTGGMPDYYLVPSDNEVNSSSKNLNPNMMSTPQWNVVNW